jgi:hypothetical protein
LGPIFVLLPGAEQCLPGPNFWQKNGSNVILVFTKNAICFVEKFAKIAENDHNIDRCLEGGS